MAYIEVHRQQNLIQLCTNIINGTDVPNKHILIHTIEHLRIVFDMLGGDTEGIRWVRSWDLEIEKSGVFETTESSNFR